MAMIPATSLFDQPAASPVQGATGWIEATLLGEAAVSLCVIGVAILGFAMLGGRLPMRRGARVVLGCFVLLSAGAFGSGIAGAWREVKPVPLHKGARTPIVAFEREPLPEATYDPYAGASLRRD